MGSPSKEENILELFYNEPTKHWHFSQIVKSAKVSERAASHWLNKLIKMKIIKRHKPKGKMPYFIANYSNQEYLIKKKLFAQEKLYRGGLLNYLSSLGGTIVLFGSMTRGDWHKNSDIDIFIYGNKQKLNLSKFEKALNRDIQVFSYENRNDLKRVSREMIKDILRGDIIKGDLDFLEVKASA